MSFFCFYTLLPCLEDIVIIAERVSNTMPSLLLMSILLLAISATKQLLSCYLDTLHDQVRIQIRSSD